MVFRQAQAALLPTVTRTPHELATANAAATTIEGAGILAGPLLCGAIVALASVTAAFPVTALLAALATAAAAAIHVPVARREPRSAGRAVAVRPLSGLRRAAVNPPVRLILGLLLAQTTVSGALNVFVVVCALELLDFGRAGVGTLTAAYGIGGLLAGVGALAWAGRADMVRWVSVGLVLWGLPLVVLGAVPNPALALGLLATIGLGNTLFDVASVTLLQRTVAEDALAMVFGALETVVVVGLGLGALLAPAAIQGLGIRNALLVTGALLPSSCSPPDRRFAS
jgi:predicted MFS family arabinose efflux permease